MRNLLVIVVAVVLYGCADAPRKVMTSSLEDLANETISYDSFLVNYKTIMSISGLAPAQAMGQTVHHPETASPAYGIGIAPLLSYYTDIQLRPGKGSDPDDEKAFDAVTKQYERIRSQTIALALRAGELRAIDLALALAWQQRADPATAQTLPVIGSLLQLQCTSDCAFPQLFSKLVALRRELAADETKLERDKVALQDSIRDTSVIVIRWRTSDEDKYAAKLGTRASIDGTSQSTTTGTAIFNGLRVQTMHFGEDFRLMVGAEPGMSFALQHVGIVSHLVLAKNFQYFSDQDFANAFRAGLSGKLSDLQSLKGLLKELPDISVELSYALSSLASLGASGRTVGARISRKDFCFFPSDSYQKSINASISDLTDPVTGTGYRSVMSVRARPSAILSLAFTAAQRSKNSNNVESRINNPKLPCESKNW